MSSFERFFVLNTKIRHYIFKYINIDIFVSEYESWKFNGKFRLKFIELLVK